jgi:hypothetical protein
MAEYNHEKVSTLMEAYAQLREGIILWRYEQIFEPSLDKRNNRIIKLRELLIDLRNAVPRELQELLKIGDLEREIIS